MEILHGEPSWEPTHFLELRLDVKAMPKVCRCCEDTFLTYGPHSVACRQRLMAIYDTFMTYFYKKYCRAEAGNDLPTPRKPCITV